MIRGLRSLFGWRDVLDTGVWLYRENAITGHRCAQRSNAAGWQPVDQLWLDGVGQMPSRYVPPNTAAAAWVDAGRQPNTRPAPSL